MFLDVQHAPLHGLPRLPRIRGDIRVLPSSPLFFLPYRLLRVRVVRDGKRCRRSRSEHAVPVCELKQGVYQRPNGVPGRRHRVVIRRIIEVEEGRVVAKRARVSRSIGAFGID